MRPLSGLPDCHYRLVSKKKPASRQRRALFVAWHLFGSSFHYNKFIARNPTRLEWICPRQLSLLLLLLLLLSLPPRLPITPVHPSYPSYPSLLSHRSHRSLLSFMLGDRRATRPTISSP